MAAECPACFFRFLLPPNSVKGEHIQCPDCGKELVIASRNPDTMERAGGDEAGDEGEESEEGDTGL